MQPNFLAIVFSWLILKHSPLDCISSSSNKILKDALAVNSRVELSLFFQWLTFCTEWLALDHNFLTLILSFCPGGIYEVAVIAIAFDLEPDFVAFHHIIRLLFILFVVPVILRLIEKTKIKN